MLMNYKKDSYLWKNRKEILTSIQTLKSKEVLHLELLKMQKTDDLGENESNSEISHTINNFELLQKFITY